MFDRPASSMSVITNPSWERSPGPLAKDASVMMFMCAMLMLLAV